jgi:hypothetical protein
MQIITMPPTEQCEGEVNTEYMQRGEMTAASNQQNKEKKVKLLIAMCYNIKILKILMFFIRNNLVQYISFKHFKYFQSA